MNTHEGKYYDPKILKQSSSTDFGGLGATRGPQGPSK